MNHSYLQASDLQRYIWDAAYASGGIYDTLDVHRAMLRDEVRNEAYRRALADAVRPGDVVLDVGAGTGILSLLAARSGAGRVYAVERSATASLAAAIAARNGLTDRIIVLHGDLEHVRLPEPVDLIVSEWLGVYGVDENLLPIVLVARDRWLKPGGRILPDRVVSWLAPVWDERLENELAYFRNAPFGLDLRPIADGASHQIAWSRDGVAPGDVKAEPSPLWEVDLYRYPTPAAASPFRASLAFDAAEESTVNALAAWFEARFGSAALLTNAPGSPPTHWGQYLFPLDRPRKLEPGTRLHVDFSCIPAGPGYCQHSWSVRVGSEVAEHHDTRRGGGPGWHEL
jgi:SAM-dependent methyltransferase